MCSIQLYSLESLWFVQGFNLKIVFPTLFQFLTSPPLQIVQNLYFSKFLYHSNLGNWNCFPRFKPPLTYDLLLLYQVSLSLHYTLSSLDITNRSRAQSANPDHSPSPLQYRLQLIVSYLVMRQTCYQLKREFY